MLQWAKENQTAFYTVVYPKLLPTELAESGAGQSIQVYVYGKPMTDMPVVLGQQDKTLTVKPLASEGGDCPDGQGETKGTRRGYSQAQDTGHRDSQAQESDQVTE